MKKILTLLAIVSLSLPVFADPETDKKTVGDKIESGVDKTKAAAKEGWQDTKKVTNKAVNAAKDKTCELVNGKMECAVKKVGHKIENGVGEGKDKLNDLKKE